MTRAERVDVANRIIEVVAAHGRRFLSTNSDVRDPQPNPRLSRFEVANGRVWYVDKYRGSRIYVHHDPVVRRGWGWRFSDGGTLLSLMRHLRDFIVKGTPVDPRYFGPFPGWCSSGDPWGYGSDMAVVGAKVAEIVALLPQEPLSCR